MKKVAGIPIKVDGVWIPEWTMEDGSKDWSPFGWKDKASTERHIKNILENQ